MEVTQTRPWLSAVDHITFIVRPDTIRKWTWLYVEVFGGKFAKRIDDAIPDGQSSMMLWEIDFGPFAIALVAGIDREEKSHATVFVERHGDHMIQHIAFRPPNEDFNGLMTYLDRYRFNFQGNVLVRPEGSGHVKQVFSWPCHSEANPAEVFFFELEGRASSDAPITFSEQTAADLYESAQQAMKADERQEMTDWSLMPRDWEPPEVE